MGWDCSAVCQCLCVPGGANEVLEEETHDADGPCLAGGGMPELASPASFMLACTAVTSVTPNESNPPVLTHCHPHLTLSCRAPCWKCGQVLQEEGEGLSSCTSA